MMNFEFFAPTKIIFGACAEQKTAELLLSQKAKKILVHFGGKSSKESGLLDRILALLDESGLEYVTLGGVLPNARLQKVYEGIELCKNEGVDFILAIGGGSVIDSAKAIAFGAANDLDVWDLYLGKAVAKSCLPLGCVLTIAAAGSEMSNSSVITNDDGQLKRSYNDDLSRLKFAVLNPVLTFSVPPYQTACGIADILMHTMERYFSRTENADLTFSIAESVMSCVIKNGYIVMRNPTHYEARAEIMWAGSLSHNGLTGCGTEGDWACHQLAHGLSGFYDVAHGAALTAVWGSWARYSMQKNMERFARYGRNIFQIESDDTEVAAVRGIEKTEAFFKKIGMPTSITELGITLTDEIIEKLTNDCSRNKGRTVGTLKVLAHDDIRRIYNMAK